MKFHIASLLLLLIVFGSCKKENFITSGDAVLSTSESSLKFDTVFTSTGSVTQFFKIYNDNNQPLRISSVKLAGGAASYFKINADGLVGPEVNNIELEANDSTYVFVTVSINPSSTDLPFVINDSISINFNGKTEWVRLEAWGQNARFIRSRVITSDETWDNTRPYVILGGLQVDTNVTLTIQKGTKIYVHADAPILIDGTLRASGEKFDSTRVIFIGDRLDLPYREFPASWPGIYFRGESKDNVLEFVSILNAYQGLVADQPSTNVNPKLTLKQCIVDNCYDAGIFGLRSSIKAENCLISNCGKNIVLAYGGVYNFNHCTSVAYSNSFITHKEPVLLITDFVKINNSILTAPLSANFTNCIFWGDNGTADDEVVTSKLGSAAFAVDFKNSLWKVKTAPTNTTVSNMIVNEDPQFDSVNNQKRIYDFRLKENSPAINKGQNTGLSLDLKGANRPVGLPDLGCYEKQ